MAESPEDKENQGKKDSGEISDEELEKLLDDFEYFLTKSFCCGK